MPDFRRAKRKRYVSYFTLRRFVQKNATHLKLGLKANLINDVPPCARRGRGVGILSAARGDCEQGRCGRDEGRSRDKAAKVPLIGWWRRQRRSPEHLTTN